MLKVLFASQFASFQGSLSRFCVGGKFNRCGNGIQFRFPDTVFAAIPLRLVMKTANISRVLRAEDDQFRAAKNPCDFSKAALRQRKEKDLANARHWVDDFMKDVKEPKSSDFKRLEQFVEVRRKVYEKCYKQIRDKRYAHKQRMDRSGIFARTNTRELAGLVTDLSKLHNVLWHWYRNGVRPRTSRLRGTAGKEIQRTTLKFLRSLLAK